MIGFPGTGKSTFLAAFWHSVSAITDFTPSGLRLHNVMPEQRAYLNAIVEEWLSYKTLTRNKSTEIQNAYMNLDNGNGKAVKLIFPDISGEIYTEMVENRTWSIQYQKLINKTDKILFFINEDITIKSPTISEVHTTTPHTSIPSANIEKAETEWHVRLVEKQVQYIDLLQLLLNYHSGKPLQKVSIIISAWDQYSDNESEPEFWLEHHAPMFYQFMKANSDKVAFKVFGVSAQGDEYVNGKINKLTEKPLSERTLIKGVGNPDISKHDITYPVRWLFEQ